MLNRQCTARQHAMGWPLQCRLAGYALSQYCKVSLQLMSTASQNCRWFVCGMVCEVNGALLWTVVDVRVDCKTAVAKWGAVLHFGGRQSAWQHCWWSLKSCNGQVQAESCLVWTGCWPRRHGSGCVHNLQTLIEMQDVMLGRSNYCVR